MGGVRDGDDARGSARGEGETDAPLKLRKKSKQQLPRGAARDRRRSTVSRGKARKKNRGSRWESGKRPCEVGADGSRRTSMWALFRGVRLPCAFSRKPGEGFLIPAGSMAAAPPMACFFAGGCAVAEKRGVLGTLKRGRARNMRKKWTRGSSAPPRPRRAPFCCPWSWRTPCRRESRTPSAAS